MNSNRKFNINTNIYIATLYRLLIIMVLYSICRYIFYAANANIYFDMTASHFLKLMRGGMKFDLTAVLYLNSLFIVLNFLPFKFTSGKLYQKALLYIYIITNTIGLAFNFIDTAYFPFTFKRMTFSIFQEFEHEASNFSLVIGLIADYWYLLLITVIFIILLIVLYKRVNVVPISISNKLFYPVTILVFGLGIWLSIAGMRGGFTRDVRPIANNNAAEYVNNPNEIAIVLNTPFSIIRTLNRNNLKELHYFSKDEADKLFSPYHYPVRQGEMNKKNVVVLIIESLAKEYIGFYNKQLENGTYKGYTPFLDSLIEQSMSFKHSFTNGWKSIDAPPAVLAGIPSPIHPYVLSNYNGNRLEGIIGILNREGYNASFYNGSPHGSMGYNAFVNLLGVKQYYSMNDYNNDADYDGWWGIWDELMLQYFANGIGRQEQPFLAIISTLTSHHPFKIPKEYEGRFPEGTLEIHKTIGYADYSLRRFFETASKQPWYNNTIFAITGDHTNQSDHEYYLNPVGSPEVPVILFDPSNSSFKGLIEDRPSQQIDIFPMLLGYLNCSQPYFSFGQDALNTPADDVFAIGNNETVYHKNFALLHKNIQPTALYDMTNDPLLKNNLLQQHDSIANRMMDYYKAFQQQFNYTLIHNKTIIE